MGANVDYRKLLKCVIERFNNMEGVDYLHGEYVAAEMGLTSEEWDALRDAANEVYEKRGWQPLPKPK